jgi:hypothetical protein
MKNGKVKFWVFALVLGVIVLLSGCASANAGVLVDPVIPKTGESLITVERRNTAAGAAVTMHVWVDDEEQMTLKRGEIKQAAVPNGQHTIQAGSSWVDRGDALTVTLNSEEVSIFGEPAMGLFGARFKLTETGRKPF